MGRITDEVLASTAAGFASTLLGTPLDAVKVRLQHLQQPGMTTWGCALGMLRTEGVHTFFRGMGPPLVNSVLMNSVMFVVFAEVKSRLPDTIGGALTAGAVSGLAQSALSTPMDFLKIQQQLSGGRPLLIIKDMTARHGFRGALPMFFVGHSMNMLREGVFTAVYLGLYSRLRQHVELEHDTHEVHLWHVMAASSTTGALAWCACYPFDTVKSVQQSQPASGKHTLLRSIFGAGRHIWSRGGLSAFYRGVFASTSRAVLVTCSRLVAYETVKALL